MGRFFVDNGGLLMPVGLIVLWFSVSALSRCSGCLLRKVRDFFSAANGRPSTSLRSSRSNMAT